MTCPGCGAPDAQGCYKGCPETMTPSERVTASEATYPVQAMCQAYARGFKAGREAAELRAKEEAEFLAD